MSETKQLNIGLIGAGVVGGGVVKHLTRNADLIAERLGMRLHLKWVCDKDESRLKALPTSAAHLTGDAQRCCRIPTSMWSSNSLAAPASPRRSSSMPSTAARWSSPPTRRCSPMTARRSSLPQRRTRTNIFYEASVCGGIPIIGRCAKDSSPTASSSIYGIVNGTCNYILSRMTAERADFEEALAEAQAHGYAEADPSLDVDGVDSAHKATILASLAHGFWTGSTTPTSKASVRFHSWTSKSPANSATRSSCWRSSRATAKRPPSKCACIRH